MSALSSLGEYSGYCDGILLARPKVELEVDLPATKLNFSHRSDAILDPENTGAAKKLFV